MLDHLEQQQLIVATMSSKTRIMDIPLEELSSVDNSDFPIPVSSHISNSNDPIRSLSSEPLFFNINEINPNIDIPFQPNNNLKNIDDTFEVSTPMYNLSELPYCLSTLSGPRPLMYLTFNVYGQSNKALVDSSASRLFISLNGLELFKNLDFKTIYKQGKDRVANS